MNEAVLTFSARIGTGIQVRDFRTIAQIAEDSGFDQIWTGNDLFKRSGIVPVTLALAATSRIKVGSSVLNPVSLHPAEIAMLAANLQDLSGGRYLLGIGAGSEVYLRWAGVEPTSPVRRTREGMLAVRALLNGASPAGVPGVAAGWQPAARLEAGAAPTPIYLGGMGPRMLELAGREADGVLALCLPPSRYHWVTERIAAGAQKRGRSIDDLDVACCVWVAIDSDRGRAETMLAEKIALYSGALSRDALAGAGFDPDDFLRLQQLVDAGDVQGATRAVTRQMLTLGIAGDVPAVIDRCQELIDEGVRHLSFGHPHGADRVEAIKVLGSQVLPALRSYANSRAEQQPSKGNVQQ